MTQSTFDRLMDVQEVCRLWCHRYSASTVPQFLRDALVDAERAHRLTRLPPDACGGGIVGRESTPAAAAGEANR